jgi:hypothetical protein
MIVGNMPTLGASGWISRLYVAVICLVTLAWIFAVCRGGGQTSEAQKEPSPPETPKFAVSPQKAASPSISSIPAASRGGSGWRPALAHLWTGVKLCDSNSHEFVFEVLGGSEKYLAPDGRRIRGLKVRYPDGTIEWKDRDWIVDSGQFVVRANDPALARQSWQEYEY